MASHPLPNHLLANRKRSALSQKDVAFLLGRDSGAKICRYERFMREPGLKTVMALEIIFRRSISELFPGLFETILIEVKGRAAKLDEKVSRGKSNDTKTRKRQVLQLIISAVPKPPEKRK